MSDCLIDGPIKLKCFSVGGVEQVALANFEALKYEKTKKTITGIDASPAVFPDFYKMAQEMESAGLTQTIVANRENMTVHYVSTLTLKFGELDEDELEQLIKISRAPLMCVLKTNSGKWIYLGEENPGRLSEGESNIGITMEDMNGVTLSIEFKSKNGFSFIDSDLIGTALTIIDTPSI